MPNQTPDTNISAKLDRICVYCGSGPGRNPDYTTAARRLGTILGENSIGLVYGGGSVGLMGDVARAAIEAGGHVTGIIPAFLSDREQMLHEAQDLIITNDMHERKLLMFEQADAFVALPGGLGTLEELVEQMTWSQLGQHNKPIVIANIGCFWDPVLALFAHMRSEHFIRPGMEAKVLVVGDVGEIVPVIREALAPEDTEASARISQKF